MAAASVQQVGDKVICPEMGYYCFESLIKHFDSKPVGSPKFTNEAYPLFVTWKKGPQKDLRGCIGTFSPLNLHQGLKDYSIISATEDSRFEPIERDEVSDLFVSISLLTNFEKAKDYLDWVIGVHGIRIEFDSPNGRHSATYLPEVAQEANWDQVKTIDNLIRKSGFRGKIAQDLRESIRVTRYQSEKLTVSYVDYIEKSK